MSGPQISDVAHNDEIDRRDAIRFRRLVKAAIDNDIWFLRMAQNVTPQPKTLKEAREMLDTIIRRENA